MHLMEQRLQEVLILQTQTERKPLFLYRKQISLTLNVNNGQDTRTHCEFLNLSSKRRMESNVLEERGSKPHAKAGFLPLTVFLEGKKKKKQQMRQ